MNVGLVLAGGFARGAYQIGALKAISEFVPRDDIKYISASSVGVLNGYAFETSGIEKAEKMWKNITPNNATVYMNQILRSNIVQQSIANLFEEEPFVSKKFYATLFNLGCKKVVYKDLASVDSKEIPTYLKASITLPIHSNPIQIGGVKYYDGGIADNIPVYPLLKHQLDYIICIYFDENCYKFENSYFDNKTIKLRFSSRSLRQTLSVTKDGIDEMIEEGYEKTRHMLKYIFLEGTENLEYIYRAIEFLNQGNQPKTRITTDVIITNVNKLTQKFTQKKIL